MLLKSTLSNITALFYPCIVKMANLRLAVFFRGFPPVY
jgi:hypothetical protein